jgi:hypothetical protein
MSPGLDVEGGPVVVNAHASPAGIVDDGLSGQWALPPDAVSAAAM